MGENGWRVGFAEDEDGDESAGRHGDSEGPEDRAPTPGSNEEAAAHGPDDGTYERPHAPNRHCAATLERNEHVCHGAATYGDWSGASDAGQKPEKDKGGEGRGVGACDGEDDKEDVRDVVDVEAPIKFGSRSDQDGAENVAEYKDRYNEGGKEGVGGVEFSHYPWYAGGEHGRSKGTGGEQVSDG